MKVYLNSFEKNAYAEILSYWENLVEGPINFKSKKHLKLVKDLNLNSRDIFVLEEIYKESNSVIC